MRYACAVVPDQVLPDPALAYLPETRATRAHRSFCNSRFRLLTSVFGRGLASIGWRGELRTRLGEQRQPLPLVAFSHGVEGRRRAGRGRDRVSGDCLLSEEAGRSPVVWSRSHGWSALGVADCPSLVFHLVDSTLTVFTVALLGCPK